VTSVRDIGRVEVGAADYGSTAYMDRSDATALLIYAQPGANSLAVDAKSVAMKDLRRSSLRASITKSFTIRRPSSPSRSERWSSQFHRHPSRARRRVPVSAKLESLDIPVIAIPVSLVGTFAVLYPLGISLTTFHFLRWFSRSASSSTTRSLLSKTSSATCAPACRRPMPLTKDDG